MSNVKTKPLVSVCCLTYNQESYVKQMLDSIICQNVDFDIEILVHDDASSDETIPILHNYAKRYPYIKLLLEDENQFNKGLSYLKKFLFPSAQGKYIAICEGDDYWTCPYKLKRQIEFLELHQECSLTVHSALVLTGKEDAVSGVMGMGDQDRTLSLYEISAEWHLPTASFVFRTEDAQSFAEEWSFSTPAGDFPLAFYLATKGIVHYFSESMSAYRFGSQGSWTSINSQDESRLIENGRKWLSMLARIDYMTEQNYHKEIIANANNKIIRLYQRIGKAALTSPIGREAYDSLRLSSRIKCYALRLLWLAGFDMRRVTWGGRRQWAMSRRSHHES